MKMKIHLKNKRESINVQKETERFGKLIKKSRNKNQRKRKSWP